ncbi:MAG: cytidine deaminase [Bacillota bacterium]|uniref:cytidine deaminase n=1 Tax=Desulforudis sp. DRI-14 TaxID=3459793 RepID=UPI00347A35CF
MSNEELVKAALQARTGSYAPYSGFRVGAALLTPGGRVFTGCNVENASYGLTMCAERVAVGKAVSEGEREFVAIAVAGNGREKCLPCGACRQVLAEFAPDMAVIAVNEYGDYSVTRLNELLPQSFCLPSGK